MKKRLIAVLGLALVVLISAALAQNKGPGFSTANGGQWYDRSVALVVGISQYGNGWSSLTEPRNDANRVAQALQAQGFEVIKLTDTQASRANIMRQIETVIPAKVGKNGRFIFYYSGHGQTEVAARSGRQLGYIIPADGRMTGGTDDWSSYISMDALRGQINNKIPAKHVLVIFDSCFSGTALTKSGTMTGNVNYFLGQPAINVLTAGDAGQPTPDGAFSYDFVNAINGSADGVGGQRDGYVTFAEVGTYLQAQIPAKVPGLSPSFGWWDGTSQMVFQYGGSAPPPPVAVKPEPVPDLSGYDALAQAEQQKAEAAESVKRSKQKAAQSAYSKVKEYKESASYNKSTKKALYQKFLSDYGDKSDNPWYDEVNGWLNQADAPEGMAWIPGGWFTMGCSTGDSDCQSDEKPAKNVYVDAFHMDVYEVTQSEYQRVTGTNPSSFKNCADCPVENVSWNDASNYCAKVGKRLPTEAEWEYAARGGTTGARYGNLDDVAWYGGNSGNKTHPVGQKQPNAYGLYDMLGNVWEWNQDWYDENWYSQMPERNPVNTKNNSLRVLRGGGWTDDPGLVRASGRGGGLPTTAGNGMGFRCSRD